ncbi:MAG: hypothetical protein ABSC51_00695 [Gaiellaceae bacterium]|jgi:hypothetical protein
MPAAKSLVEHVRQRSFRSRRHHPLLSGRALPWPELAQIQSWYVAATSDAERREIGRQFEKAVQEFHADGPVTAEEELLALKIEAILAMGPVQVNLDLSRSESAVFTRRQCAEQLRLAGWKVAKIAPALEVSATTIRSDLAFMRSAALE